MKKILTSMTSPKDQTTKTKNTLCSQRQAIHPDPQDDIQTIEQSPRERDPPQSQ